MDGQRSSDGNPWPYLVDGEDELFYPLPSSRHGSESRSERKSSGPLANGFGIEGPIKIAQYYKNISLSNPSSVHASPEKGPPSITRRQQLAKTENMSLLNSMFSPTFARKPPSGSRPVGSGAIGGGFGGGFGNGSFQGASSLPYGGEYSARPSAQHAITSSGEDVNRRSNLQRMRVHRSLEGDFPFDPSQQCSLDIKPPADPPAGGDASFQQSSPLLYAGASSLSQGNLLNMSSRSAGGPFSNAVTGAYSNFGQASNVNLGNPVQSSTALSGVMDANPYRQFQQVQQPATYFNNPFSNRDPYSLPLPTLQREYEILLREYENSMQKLNSTMNSIKTFWSPELKKERSMRKEETAKLALVQEQLRMASQEGQKQAQVIRQLQDELQCQYELSRTLRDTEIQSVPRDEYEAVRLERERLHRELALARDTLRDVQLQIETQRQTLVARDEAVKKLLDMLQSKGMMTYTGAQDRMELEQLRARQIELENRCHHYEASLHQKEQSVRALQDECLSAAERLRQTQLQYDHYQRMPSDERETNALKSLLDTKHARVDQLEQRIAMYEDEISQLRELRLTAPRDFTDKSVTDKEYQDMKLKIEKLELELAQKQSELQSGHTRLTAAEEQSGDMRKRVELLKEAVTAKEQQVALYNADIETLRGKLEARNETIEQKTQQLQQIQLERNRMQSDIADLNEQLKIRETKIASLQRKVETLDEMVKEREGQIELMKQRLAASPAMIQQKQFQEQLDELMSERDHLLQQMRDQRDRVETERLEELDVHRREVRDLRLAIESLQKEITDRQVLIESQNEKISDMNREVTALRVDVQTHATRQMDDYQAREIERLNQELQDARSEVERLLRIVSSLEKEKESMNLQLKELERQLEEAKSKYSTPTSTLERRKTDKTELDRMGKEQQVGMGQKEQRIQELEEALKESVSITAEREMAIAQQKQMTQQLETKINQYKDQMNKIQRQYEEMSSKLTTLHQDKQEKDTLIQSLRSERRNHLEETLQLKEEALLAAISEKDAHIALLETSQTKNPEEIETLHRHKEKLIKKLKDENVRRVKLFNELKEEALGIGPRAVGVEATSAPIAKDLKPSPADQEDDAEGIWA